MKTSALQLATVYSRRHFQSSHEPLAHSGDSAERRRYSNRKLVVLFREPPARFMIAMCDFKIAEACHEPERRPPARRVSYSPSPALRTRGRRSAGLVHGWLLNILLIPLLALFAGCKKPAESAAANSNGSTPKPRFIIGMSQCNLGEPWRVQQNADIRAAAAKYPELKVIYNDAQNDALRQIYQVGQFVRMKVNLIIISPLETQPLTKPVAQAMEAGIPVIVLDRRILGTNYTCFIGGDNKAIGQAAGKWIVQALRGKGNVVELEGLMTTTPGQLRHQGFSEAIAGTDIHVIFQSDMQWLQSVARTEMESALDRYKNIDLVFAANDDGAHGAYLAAKATGRAKDMMFVGIDGLQQEGVAWVKQGILDATFRYPTGGAQAIAEAWKILHSKKVPKDIVLPSRMFDKANVDQGGQPVHY